MRNAMLVLLIVLLIASLPLVGTSTEVWRSWEPGNSSYTVLALEQHVWVSGPGAIVRWDKASGEYQTFTRHDGPAATHYYQIAAAPDGTVYFSKDGLITSYDGQTWRNWEFDSELGWGIAVDRLGRLWTFSYTNIAVYDGVSWEYMTLDFPIGTMCSDPDGSIWFSGLYKNLVCMDGDELIRYERPYPDSQTWDHQWMVADPYGKIYIRDSDAFCVLDPSTGDWDRYELPEADNFMAWYFDSFDVDSEGTIWIPMPLDNGLVAFDGEQMTWYRDDALRGSYESVCIDDNNGSIWVTSTCEGLFSLEGIEFESWRVSSELKGLPERVANDNQGDIWFGCGNGKLGLFGGDSWCWPYDVYGSQYGMRYFQDIVQGPDGGVFVAVSPGLDGGQYGVYWLDAEGGFYDYGRPITPLSENYLPYAMVVDRQDEIWLGGSHVGEVFRLDGSSWSRFDGLPDTQYGHPVRAIALDPNAGVWVGGGYDPPIMGNELALAYFDGQEWHIFPDIPDPISACGVISIAFDSEGVLWVVSKDTIWSFDMSIWQSQTPPLQPYQYNVVYVDRFDRKWFGTSYGVVMLDASGWHTFESGDSGLNSGGVYDIMMDNEDRMWFISHDGVVRLDIAEEVMPLEISANIEHVGDSFRLEVRGSCDNPFGQLDADFYLSVSVEDGGTVFLPSFSEESSPLYRKLTLPDDLHAMDVLLYSATFDSIPAGDYEVKGLVTNRGCFASPLSTEAVTPLVWGD